MDSTANQATLNNQRAYATPPGIDQVVPSTEVQAWLKSKGKNFEIDELATLTELDLSFRQIGDSDIKYILSLPNINKVNLRGDLLTYKGADTLVASNQLVDVDLSCQQNPLKMIPVPFKFSRVKVLTLEWNSISNLDYFSAKITRVKTPSNSRF